MPSAKAIPVEQLDRKTGEVLAEHDSVYAAAAALEIPGGAGSINKAANGKLKSAYGFKWRYKLIDADLEGEEWRAFDSVEVSTHGRVRRTTAGGQKLVTDVPIVTISGRAWPIHRLMAHVFLGMPDDSSRSVKVDGDAVHVDNIRICGQKRACVDPDRVNPKAPRAVQQWTHNGVHLLNEFKSVSEAARALGISTSHISKCAAGNEQTAGGFRWKYAA